MHPGIRANTALPARPVPPTPHSTPTAISSGTDVTVQPERRQNRREPEYEVPVEVPHPPGHGLDEQRPVDLAGGPWAPSARNRMRCRRGRWTAAARRSRGSPRPGSDPPGGPALRRRDGGDDVPAAACSGAVRPSSSGSSASTWPGTGTRASRAVARSPAARAAADHVSEMRRGPLLAPPALVEPRPATSGACRALPEGAPAAASQRGAAEDARRRAARQPGQCLLGPPGAQQPPRHLARRPRSPCA